MFRRILSFFIFLSLTTSTALAACDASSSPTGGVISTKLKIDALYPNPNTGEAEWIELTNNGPTSVELSNYTLEDATAKPWATSGTLESGEAIQITGFPFQLNNSNETVTLKTKDSVLVDTWTYATSTKGQILKRDSSTSASNTSTSSSQTNSPTSSSSAATGSSTSTSVSSSTSSASTAPVSQPLQTPALYPSFSEAFPNPEGSDEDAEWIELYNPHGETLNLNGLYLDDSDGGSSPHALSGNIGPESYLLFPISETHITLNNTDDHVRLLGVSQEVLWDIAYTKCKEAQSYALVNGSGVWTTPTPGEENEAPATEESSSSTSTDTKTSTSSTSQDPNLDPAQNGDLSESIELTEVFPNPEGPDLENEWIELTNGGTETVNLGNWILDDGDGGSAPYIFPNDAIIAPGQTFVVYRSLSKIALNNSNETVLLKDFNQETIDQLHYDKSIEDESYAKITIADANSLQASVEALPSSTESVWEWIDTPSPGHLNPTWARVEGSVKSWTDQTLTLESHGKEWPIQVTDTKLTDELLFNIGNVLSVQMIPSSGGLYTLVNAELEGSPNSSQSSQNPGSATSYWAWTLCGALLLAGAVYWKSRKSIENSPPSILE